MDNAEAANLAVGVADAVGAQESYVAQLAKRSKPAKGVV